MNHRAIGTGLAVLALLSSGCGLCTGVQRGIADYYFPGGQGPPVAQPHELPKAPVASEAPGNALRSIAGNRFSFKEFNTGPRIHMPLKTEQAEAP